MDVNFEPEALEASLDNLDTVEEFDSGVSYDKFIVLSKKDLNNFIRVVEPLTKSAIDDFGKSVLIKPISNDSVELRYTNSPYQLITHMTNKSGKMTKSFVVSIAVLKKLVTNIVSSLILVEENDAMNIALCESLLYLDTKPLKEEQFDFQVKECTKNIDCELAIYDFKKLGAALTLTDRASEKNIVISKGKAYYSTGVFAAKADSPFEAEDSFVLYKQVADVIATLAEQTVTSLKYSINESIMSINCDENTYLEVQIGAEDKVQEFLSPTISYTLDFNPDIALINDNLARLVSITKSLDYLSDIVTLSVQPKQIGFIITSENQSKSSTYSFPIIEGTPDQTGEMKFTVDVLQIFLNLAANSGNYACTENGLGLKTEHAIFLIRKSATK